jgi:hypothetical protein
MGHQDWGLLVAIIFAIGLCGVIAKALPPSGYCPKCGAPPPPGGSGLCTGWQLDPLEGEKPCDYRWYDGPRGEIKKR